MSDDTPQMVPVLKKPRPKEASSYFEMSQNNVGTDDNSHAFLIGSTDGAPPVPALAWDTDPNTEGPLGIDISAVEDTTFLPFSGNAPPPIVETQADPEDGDQSDDPTS